MDFTRFIRSFAYAWKGLKYLFRKEQNARIHLFVAGVVLPAGILLDLTFPEWGIIVLCMGWVLFAEALNTAAERLTDLVHPGRSDLAGRVKDLSAGAVLISVITSVITGLLIFGSKIS